MRDRPPTPFRPLQIAFAFAALVCAVASAQPSIDDTVRRVRELEREIAELLDALPPDQRAEVERRLDEPELTPEPAPAPPERVRCRALGILDTNGDAQISGADRFWRHLYLVLEGESEPASLFDLDIRQVTVDLDAYTTDNDFVGDVDLGEEAVFRLVVRRRGPSRGSLALDADGLRRAEGPSLTDSQGRPLQGIQRLRNGQSLVDSAGATHPISCAPPPK